MYQKKWLPKTSSFTIAPFYFEYDFLYNYGADFNFHHIFFYKKNYFFLIKIIFIKLITINFRIMLLEFKLKPKNTVCRVNLKKKNGI